MNDKTITRRRHIHVGRSRGIGCDAVCGSTAAAVSPNGARLYDRPPPFTSTRIFVDCPKCAKIARRAIGDGAEWSKGIEIAPHDYVGAVPAALPDDAAPVAPSRGVVVRALALALVTLDARIGAYMELDTDAPSTLDVDELFALDNALQLIRNAAEIASSAARTVRTVTDARADAVRSIAAGGAT